MTERIYAFDIDGTIIPGALAERAFVELGVQGLLAMTDDEFNAILSLDTVDHNEYVRQAVRGLNHGVRNISRTHLTSAAMIVAEREAETVFAEINAEIATAKKVGAKVVIISASPKLFVEAFGRVIGADYSDGALWHFVDDVIDPTVNQHNIQFDKGERLLTISEALGGHSVAAFGDTRNDIPMFELSDRPVAVNPKPDLRETAAVRGWEIIDCVDEGTKS